MPPATPRSPGTRALATGSMPGAGESTRVAPAVADPAGWVAAGALALLCFAIGALRMRHGWAGALDLGLFDQGVWLLSQGRAPELTIIDDNLFGDHLSLVLLLFAPLYRLAATPLWLIAAQALAAGATVVPIRRLARDLGRSPATATVMTLASAPLLAAVTFDFHPVVMTMPFTAWAIGAARRGDRRAVTIAGLCIGFIRADTAIVLLGVAVLADPRVRRRLVLIGVGWASIGAIVPTLLHSEQTFARHWGALGSTPMDAATHPWRVVPALLSAQTLATLVIWLLPIGALVLLQPRWTVALLLAGAPLLLADNVAVSMPWFHHAATVAPFAIGGALAALADDPQRRHIQHLVLGAGLVAALAVASPLAPNAPDSARLASITSDNRPPGLDEALSRVDADDAVTADRLILARLARRDTAYQFPCPTVVVDDVRCAAPDRTPAADVAITVASHAEALRAQGWVVELMPGNAILVATRP